MNVDEFLPFFIPIVILEGMLLIITLRHILTHTQYKRGNRNLWIAVSIIGVAFIGPLLYFTLGKEDA